MLDRLAQALKKKIEDKKEKIHEENRKSQLKENPIFVMLKKKLTLMLKKKKAEMIQAAAMYDHSPDPLVPKKVKVHRRDNCHTCQMHDKI